SCAELANGAAWPASPTCFQKTRLRQSTNTLSHGQMPTGTTSDHERMIEMTLRPLRHAVWAAALLMAGASAPALAAYDYPPTYAQDRAEIKDLTARYLFAIDYFDWDAYVATFAEDGELEFASGTSKGRDAIRQAVTSFSKRIGEFYHTEDGQPAKLRHVVLQSSIRVEGDRAW